MQDALVLLGICLFMFSILVLPITLMERTERKLWEQGEEARNEKWKRVAERRARGEI
mgnify:CR=1 FL=1